MKNKMFTSGGGFRVNHNWSVDRTSSAANSAVFYRDGEGDSWGTLSTVEARELIEVLQAIIADYPKESTNEEILNELPVGSVVQAYSNVNFMKAGIGWYNPTGYLYSSKRLAQEDFTVKLRGPEDGGDE